jgi:hypothetical protein
MLANATESFIPDRGKLATKANQSKDLYVEPDFNFQTFNTYTLELNVNDYEGQPLEGAILRIFSFDGENGKLEDIQPANMSMLGIVRADSYGSVYQTIEISQSVKHILLELHNKSANNQVVIKLAGKEYISHTFNLD